MNTTFNKQDFIQAVNDSIAGYYVSPTIRTRVAAYLEEQITEARRRYLAGEFTLSQKLYVETWADTTLARF